MVVSLSLREDFQFVPIDLGSNHPLQLFYVYLNLPLLISLVHISEPPFCENRAFAAKLKGGQGPTSTRYTLPMAKT